MIRDTHRSARLERADRIVGWTLLDQLARERMQKTRVNDQEPAVAFTIGEVTMKRDHRMGPQRKDGLT